MASTVYGDLGNGRYRNPILFADFSDPDPICVGDDFYLTASSFNCSPGLPILHSRDLVNWSIIGYAIDRFPFPTYDQPQYGKGVWAPALRYHAGRFWIFFGAPDEGIFMTSAERAEGPWTPLHCVQEGKGLIDPCPFWDDDGSAWLVRAQAGSRCGGVNSLLTLHGMEPDGSRLLDAGEVIIDGHHHHPVVEGPKMYKRNGYYYIFAPAGGVRGGWQTVFRSRTLQGPYEDRIVLVQGNTKINGPHQGGWVETANGEDWFLHFQDRGAFGRVVHLQPMRWEDGWPLIGDDGVAQGVYEPVLEHAKPRTPAPAERLRLPASDPLTGPELGLQWQWMANANPSWFEFDGNGLRLHAQGTPGGKAHWFEAGNLLMQKLLDPSLRVQVALDGSALKAGDQAGLIMTGGTSGAIFLRRTEEGWEVCLGLLESPNAEEPALVAGAKIESAKVVLGLQLRDGAVSFRFTTDGSLWKELGPPLIPTDAAWMGAKVGLFCLNLGAAPSGGSVLCQDFQYEPLSL